MQLIAGGLVATLNAAIRCASRSRLSCQLRARPPLKGNKPSDSMPADPFRRGQDHRRRGFEPCCLIGAPCRPAAGRLPKLHRTFGRRDRQISVGDFSAQCLTDAAKRRYCACAALRFWRVQVEACQPAGNGMSGQTGWSSLAALGVPL